MDEIVLIIGGILGFILAQFLSRKSEGRKGILHPLIFFIKNYKIHLHHWLWASGILIILILFKFYNFFIFGILIGIILQGLTYHDFSQIFIKLRRRGK